MGKMKANRKFVEADERAVSAVIGVILMVAITVAIAATVYVYVSGMLGSGPGSTPSVSITSAPSGKNCIVTVATPTSASIQWSGVWFNLVNVTGGGAQSLTNSIVVIPRTGVVRGGDIITVTGGLKTQCQYTVTLVYNTTGGTMGSVTWSQP